MHAYVVKDWMRVPILLSLTHLLQGNGSKNLTECCIDSLEEYNGVSSDMLPSRLISINTNGSSMFTGSRSQVTTTILENLVSFAIGVHYVAHRMNLCVQTMFVVPIVHNVKELYQSIYTYFNKSPKCHLEFSVLIDFIKTESNWVLQNVQT